LVGYVVPRLERDEIVGIAAGLRLDWFSPAPSERIQSVCRNGSTPPVELNGN
jgi:hypothetical protein